MPSDWMGYVRKSIFWSRLSFTTEISKRKTKELCNIIGKAFLTESINPDGWCLAIGRADGLSSVGCIETIQLPSTQLIQTMGPWQGV